MAIPVKSLDQATLRDVAQLLAAETEDFNVLVRLAGLDPARDFRHTDMSGTSMAGADLRGFDFTGADFRNVKLDGARIDGACFKGADLSGTDLSAARGIEAADCSFAIFQDAPFAPEMVVLPAGSFLMGSPKSEAGRKGDESPQRQVTVASFAIGRYPVTFDEYDDCCVRMNWEKPDDHGWGRGKRPVINVTWLDARAYVSWLSEKTARDYRLASEAEWEYACRAGTKTAYWWGDQFDPGMANTSESGPGRTTEVNCYPANPWGLFDTLGNVDEWAEDYYHSSYKTAPCDGRAWLDPTAEDDRRVLRGGSWVNRRVSARCAARHRVDSLGLSFDIGFRAVCSSPVSQR
jgi:formylglycine-generating enzyme required for sulfatase activity